MAVSGHEATIHVGSTVPYKTSDTRDEQGALRTFELVHTVDVGVKLVVTPYLNDDGQIIMVITQEVSNVVDFRDGVPEISRATSSTTVGVQDATTVVMAGLLQDERRKNEQRVPILGSIPILGYLFRSSEYRNYKSEIIMFLTPHVVEDGASVEDLEKLNPFQDR
jgi:type II secretory pathway component GspD/PulD (secretin)